MKIVGLSVENIKRLSAVEIVPDPDLPIVTIGGKNGQGKSSVLDAIAYALGGKALVPEEPIRRGQTSASIKIELDDLIVTRTFSQKALPCNCGNAESHDASCDSFRMGPAQTSLSVKNKEGAKYPSAQAVLDKLLSKLTFDPQTFADADPKTQTEMLRKLVGLDTSVLDGQRKEVFSQRTEARRELSFYTANLAAAKHYPDAPSEEVSPDEAKRALNDAETCRRNYDQAAQVVRSRTSILRGLEFEQVEAEKEIQNLQERIQKITTAMIDRERTISGTRTEILQLTEKAEELKALIPDVSSVNEFIQKIGDTNEKVRANKARANIEKLVKTSQEKVDTLTNTLEEIDQKKRDLLQSVQFPISGLSIDSNTELVTYNGIPLDQASSAERYRVGVAVGLAVNPGINVLLLHNGNMLDKDSVRAIAEEAEKHNAQLWMEWVTNDKNDVTVFIEEGHVVE